MRKDVTDVTGFVKKTKLTELDKKNVSSLATKTALSVVGNKIPYISSLFKKPDYNVKISELEEKVTDHNHYEFITTPEFNNLLLAF